MLLDRRTFLAAASAGLAAPALAQSRPRVVIVGGGPGGAGCARALLREGGLDVTLVEPQAAYTTCFFSNHVIAGLRRLADNTFTYAALAAAGVTVVPARATAIDRSARSLRTEAGTLPYDALVIAPGIDFVPGAVPGWDLDRHAGIMPHAYKAGPQTDLLRRQIEAMPQGGTFALIAPPAPYRCPPGPYERVSLVAYRLSQINPTAKILIFDPKETFSKQALFEAGWQAHYPGVITRIGPEFGTDRIEVRPEAMEVVVGGEVTKVDVCNVIPAQRAGAIAGAAGLTDASGWAPVDPQTMASRADPRIHVLGDAALQGEMPKSAYAAHSQAQVAAAAIRARLLGTDAPPAQTRNICWSLLAPEDGVKLGARYTPKDGKFVASDAFISDPAEPAALRKETWEESVAWYEAFTDEIWGGARPQG